MSESRLLTGRELFYLAIASKTPYINEGRIAYDGTLLEYADKATPASMPLRLFTSQDEARREMKLLGATVPTVVRLLRREPTARELKLNKIV